jgi:hypothetical protein
MTRYNRSVGIIICAEHGRQPILVACEHVTRAIDERSSPPPYRVHDFDVHAKDERVARALSGSWLCAFWLCDECERRLEYDQPSDPETDDRLWHRAGDHVLPACRSCAERMMVSHPPRPAAPVRRHPWGRK